MSDFYNRAKQAYLVRKKKADAALEAQRRQDIEALCKWLEPNNIVEEFLSYIELRGDNDFQDKSLMDYNFLPGQRLPDRWVQVVDDQIVRDDIEALKGKGIHVNVDGDFGTNSYEMSISFSLSDLE